MKVIPSGVLRQLLFCAAGLLGAIEMTSYAGGFWLADADGVA
jgi:hypothetical protein